MFMKVEVFTAGCPLCQDPVRLVKELACGSCEVTVYDLSCQCQGGRAAALEKAASYGIVRLPAVVVDGKLARCCQDQLPITRESLAAAGLGR
jgi:hypothetical protein